MTRDGREERCARALSAAMRYGPLTEVEGPSKTGKSSGRSGSKVGGGAVEIDAVLMEVKSMVSRSAKGKVLVEMSSRASGKESKGEQEGSESG